MTEGTISGAAQQMGLTAPAVHSQLKTLENLIGSQLLDRTERGQTKLTPEGEYLLQAEAQVRATLERALRGIVALREGQEGVVVLGAVSTAKYFAPRIVAMLDQEFPGIDLSLRISNRTDTIAALSQGDLDLCIMGRPPRQPATDAVPLADHPHVIIAAPGHPLADAPSVSAADLAKERFILREIGSGTRLLAERYLERFTGQSSPRRMVMDSNETIKQAVMSGLGIAIISAHTVAQETMDGRLTPLSVEGFPINRKWFLMTPQDHQASPAAAKVGQWIIDQAADCIPTLPV